MSMQPTISPARSLDSAGTNPPKPRLVFRVGGVGRRPNRLASATPAQLTATAFELFEIIKAEVFQFHKEHAGKKTNPYTDQLPLMRVVSSLADGADRFITNAALKSGYAMQCALPFEREQYAHDFDEPSIQEFNRLLAAETKDEGEPTVFEMDGTRDQADKAYTAAGKVVVNQSDLLIAIWDGEDDKSEAGTFHRILDALQFGIPVLVIGVGPISGVHLFRETADVPPLPLPATFPAGKSPADIGETIQQVVKGLIEPPRSEQALENPDSKLKDPEVRREHYVDEIMPRKNPWFYWKWFRDFVGAEWIDDVFRVRRQPREVKDFVQAVSGDWPGWEGENKQNDLELRLHYAWADKLADFNADRYRSSFVLTYLLGALAVFLAVFPMAMKALPEIFDAGMLRDWSWIAAVRVIVSPDWVQYPIWHWMLGIASPAMEAICAALELFCIGRIVRFIWDSKSRRWQLHWLDYRLVAELVRQYRFLWRLGGPRPVFRVVALTPATGSDANPAQTWMLWHVRAVERELGLPQARVTQGYLEDYIDFYKEKLVDGQIGFHRTTVMRNERIEHRLHRSGNWFFYATAAVVAVHFVLISMYLGALVTHVSTDAMQRCCDACIVLLACISAALPAFGSAMLAIRIQGDFRRLSQRSEGLLEEFEEVHRKLAAMSSSSKPLTSSAIGEVAFYVARMMVNESLDWRVSFRKIKLEV